MSLITELTPSGKKLEKKKKKIGVAQLLITGH